MPTYEKEMSIADWSTMLQEIYFPTQNYGKQVFELHTRMVKAWSGYERFALRTPDPDRARRHLAKLFAWTCAVATRIGVNPDNALWAKYPGICPKCLQRSCTCTGPSDAIDSAALLRVSTENAALRPRSIREWERLLGTIYSRGISGAPRLAGDHLIAAACLRLGEEIGELAEAIDGDPVVDQEYQEFVANELADVFSWTFFQSNHFHEIQSSDFTTISLADALWNLYPGKCSRCDTMPCACVRGKLERELSKKGAVSLRHWDGLTSLANRSAFDVYLRSYDENKLKLTKGKTFGMIFFDLDNFGQVNKSFGHAAGDMVLREIARMSAEVVGEDGLVFRRGGEEFVVTSTKLSEPEMAVLAERLREKFENTRIEVPYEKTTTSLHVTASFGVATASISKVDGESLGSLADSRSRMAKAQGKNRVVTEEPTS